MAESLQGADYRVAVFGELADTHVLAAQLTHTLKLLPLDAVMAARHTPGLLPCRMSQHQANEIVAFLQRIGVRANTIASDAVPKLASPRVIHHARCRSDGLELLDHTGTPEALIPWNEIAALAVGRVPGEPKLHYAEQGRPSVLSAAPLPEVSRVESGASSIFELWLLCASSNQRPVRMRHDRFNYDGLKDAETSSAITNFELFVRQLVDQSKQAQLTLATRRFLDHKLLKYDFKSSSELQEQALLAWMIQQQPGS